MKDVSLYVLPFCPPCMRVMKVVRQNDIDINIKNITKGNNKEELIEKGGKFKVPMLDVNGEAIYDSRKIIKYLKENY